METDTSIPVFVVIDAILFLLRCKFYFSKKAAKKFNFSNIQYTTIGKILPLASSMIIAGIKNT